MGSWWLCPRHTEPRDRERQGFTAETGKELKVKAMGSHADREQGRLASDTKHCGSVGSWYRGCDERGVEYGTYFITSDVRYS